MSWRKQNIEYLQEGLSRQKRRVGARVKNICGNEKKASKKY